MAKLHQVPSLVVGGVVLACLLAQVQALCADEQPSGQYEVIIKLRDGTGTPLQGEGFLMKEGSGFPVSSSWINTDSTGQIALDVAEQSRTIAVVGAAGCLGCVRAS